MVFEGVFQLHNSFRNMLIWALPLNNPQSETSLTWKPREPGSQNEITHITCWRRLPLNFLNSSEQLLNIIINGQNSIAYVHKH